MNILFSLMMRLQNGNSTGGRTPLTDWQMIQFCDYNMNTTTCAPIASEEKARRFNLLIINEYDSFYVCRVKHLFAIQFDFYLHGSENKLLRVFWFWSAFRLKWSVRLKLFRIDLHTLVCHARKFSYKNKYCEHCWHFPADDWFESFEKRMYSTRINHLIETFFSFFDCLQRVGIHDRSEWKNCDVFRLQFVLYQPYQCLSECYLNDDGTAESKKSN